MARDAEVTFTSLHTPKLQRLGDVIGTDVVGASEVGDGTRHLQHTIVPTRAETEATHGRVEPMSAAPIDPAVPTKGRLG